MQLRFLLRVLPLPNRAVKEKAEARARRVCHQIVHVRDPEAEHLRQLNGKRQRKRTERNFLNIGSILFGALLILILASIVGIFVQATILQTAICAGGIFVFSGYVLYDIQVMKSGYLTEDDVPRMVLNLFLDWINLFLYILRLIGLFAADN